MKKWFLIRLVFSGIFLCYAMNLFSQNDSLQQKLSFPESWQGDWEGDLSILSLSKGKVMEVKMRLEIHRLVDDSDRFHWVIQYGEGEKLDRREYELKIIDAAKGLYLLDEKNSIAMESFFIDNQLICNFSVEGFNLICREQLLDENTMSYEISTFDVNQVSATGNTELNGEKIPAVKTFPLKGFQKAILKRNLK